MSDVWLKMAQFLGSLNGEDINRESYVRTLEYENALEAWKETEQGWEAFLETLPEGQREKVEEMKECLETLHPPRRSVLICRDMQTAYRCCFTWGF